MAFEMATEVETPLPLPDMSSPSRSFENLSLISCSSANSRQWELAIYQEEKTDRQTERSSEEEHTAVAGLPVTHAAFAAPRRAEPLQQRRLRQPCGERAHRPARVRRAVGAPGLPAALGRYVGGRLPPVAQRLVEVGVVGLRAHVHLRALVVRRRRGVHARINRPVPCSLPHFSLLDARVTRGGRRAHCLFGGGCARECARASGGQGRADRTR
jgi:hypothetical protein